MRLNRFLAGAGLGSRRNVEELIKEGRVRINGQVVTELATKVEPQDTVKVGNRVVTTQHTVHAVMNKPRNVVCTADDERDRRTIMDFIPEEWPRVFHVGRLDKESEGLLIVTNDGDLSLALTHPRFKVEKEYEVTLDKAFDPAHAEKLMRGFHIIGGRAKMEEVEQTGPNRLRVVLTQGIKRQIRLMLYEMGYEVERLIRVRIGPVVLTKMPPGTWRMLSPHEVAELKGQTPAKPRATKPRTLTQRGTPGKSSRREAGGEAPKGRTFGGRRAPSGRREGGYEEKSRGGRREQPQREGFRESREESRPRRGKSEGFGAKRSFSERPDRGRTAGPRGRRSEESGWESREERGGRREQPSRGASREGHFEKESRPFRGKREGFSPRREPSARSEEGRAPAPRRGGSHDRRSGSGRPAGEGRAGTRPERRGPRSAPRSGRSRS